MVKLCEVKTANANLKIARNGFPNRFWFRIGFSGVGAPGNAPVSLIEP